MDADLSSSPLAREAWTALGGDLADLHLVKVQGNSDGLLPSRLAVTEMMTAAAGASVLAVSALDARRESRLPVPVFLDVEHVAVAARSERYAKRLGSGLQIGMAPLSRFWQAADGWIRLHTNYPWHLDRALDVLGCDDDPAAVGGEIATRSATELEESLAAAGALGFAVRSPRTGAATLRAKPSPASRWYGPRPGRDRSGGSLRGEHWRGYGSWTSPESSPARSPPGRLPPGEPMCCDWTLRSCRRYRLRL